MGGGRFVVFELSHFQSKAALLLPDVDIGMVDEAASLMEPLEEWERVELEESSSDFGRTCFEVANMKQTSIIPRTMKWLKLSAEEEYDEGILTYTDILYGLNPDVQYVGDEAACCVKRVKHENLSGIVGSFDSDQCRAHRHLIGALLSGSLEEPRICVASIFLSM